jgi:hypothetical protein
VSTVNPEIGGFIWLCKQSAPPLQAASKARLLRPTRRTARLSRGSTPLASKSLILKALRCEKYKSGNGSDNISAGVYSVSVFELKKYGNDCSALDQLSVLKSISS